MFRWWLGLTLACLSATAAAQALHVGFGTHKPPYVFEGEPRGLEYEIVSRAAANAGFELTAYYAPMERLHLMLRERYRRGSLPDLGDIRAQGTRLDVRSQRDRLQQLSELLDGMVHVSPQDAAQLSDRIDRLESDLQGLIDNAAVEEDRAG